jgi:hypothetical protein
VKFNLAEGASGKSGTERNKYNEIARGSVVEIDAALKKFLTCSTSMKSNCKPPANS